MASGFVFRTAEQGQLNDRVLVKAEASETRGAYIVRMNDSMPPGRWIEPHVHGAEEEAWYVLSGELTFKIGEQSILAPTGSFVLVPRGTAHSFGNASTEPARYLQIFSPPGMEAYFAERATLAQTMAGKEGLDFAGLDPEGHKALARKYNLDFV